MRKITQRSITFVSDLFLALVSFVNSRCTLLRHGNWNVSSTNLQKLIVIVILWVYYTIPFGLSLFLGTFWSLLFNFTTDEGSVPEMRIWSIS